MSAVSSAAAFICGCAVVCAVINLAAPDAKMRKPAALALAVFFLCSLISPVKAFIESMSELSEQGFYNDIEQPSAAFDYNSEVLEQTVNNLEDTLDIMLREDGVTAKNISVSAHIDENNSIKLDAVDIYIDEVTTAEVLKMRNTVYKNFGLVPSITVGKTNGAEN